MVLSPQPRLVTDSDQATESLPSTSDYWRQLATMSPPPRQAPTRSSPGDTKILAWRKHAEQGAL
ncbi:hypothetical protein A2U01_0095312 [Trifolium medium]|uniref:Uncharacterized protein n=1 Tax=Trifolium medium TaxID=97028 RepID=A0A392UMD1_9FABA|nr:hypothetical protein [Trifolium medium]